MSKRTRQRKISVLLILAMLLSLFSGNYVSAEEVTTVTIGSAAELPEVLEEGKTYELTADITLASGQQITTLAGVLDGKGHTITLADNALAANVSGTIQNLGVLSSTTISLSGVSGSMALTLTGTIQNCYSLANLTTSGYDDIGGLVGTLNGGKIYNSYYAGTNSAMFADGLVGVGAENSEMANCCYTVGYSAVGMNGSKVTQTNIIKKTVSTMKESDAVTVLNTDLKDTGYQWEMAADGANEGFPVLVEITGEIVVNKAALEAKITTTEAMDRSLYTEATWAEVETALAAARVVMENESATQVDVNTALSELENAVNGLEKKRTLEAVAQPEDDENIVHITSQADLEAITAADNTKYYILDNDLALDGWYWSFDTFQGILDGQGHTITFNDSRTGLFANIGADGIVQNVHFTGSLNGDYGACGLEVLGAVVNCYTEVSGSNASGFAKRLNGGMISNCYSISTAEDGAIIEQTATPSGAVYTGTLNHVYWEKNLVQPVDLADLTISGNTSALSMATMKTMDFVNILNENRGNYGTKWGQNENGYPYFGENKDYNPDAEIVLPEDKTKLTFEVYDGSETIVVENQEIDIDINVVDDYSVAGTFVLPEYTVPEGATVEWSCGQQSPANTGAINLSTGEFFIYNEGTLVVTATLVKADGTTEVLVSTKVTSYTSEIEDIKLFLAENQGDTENAVEITDGTAIVSGSADQRIIVKAKYKDESIYSEISSKPFSFRFTENDVVHHMTDTSVFYFEKPGTAELTVTYQANPEISETVQITSEYVAIESVKPGISGTIVIHGRNGNSSSGEAFLADYYNVAVSPANASYAGNFIITSDNPEVGEYVDSMVKGYVPKKAGTVTYTATIDDNGIEKSGSETVTYVYKNPLKTVSVENASIQMEMGETVDAGLEFEGELKDGHEVTETGMIWSFDKEGIIKIARGTGGWKREEGAPDNNMFFLSDEYSITAVSEGTVIVTGTPMDTTGGAEQVMFEVSVSGGNMEPADIDKIIKEGIEVSTDFINSENAKGLEYGEEWNVITLLRAGKTIDEAILETYYQSVVDEVKTWDGTQKPTDMERTALALILLEKDITDIEGVNIAEMIYNSDLLSEGSNEMAYALLALDAADVEIPENAKWNRASMITELLKFQNEENGGFGLFDAASPSVDMTAMCLQALAPYYKSNEDVKAAVEAALEYLRNKISSNYDFDSNSNATAQVLLALAVLEIDVTDPEQGFGNQYANIITRLDEYKKDSGFAYQQNGNSNLMATYQIMQAFDAYDKAHNQGISYWNFSGRKNTPVVPDVSENQEIVRIYGETRYETSFKVADAFKEELGIEKFSTVIVATGKNFADALSGSYLAAVKNAPILLTKETRVAELHEYIKENLTADGTVYVLGGTEALPETVEAGLTGYTVKRLEGKSRYDTNIEILKEAKVSTGEILVATGKDFADSLSASAVKKPILLVKDSLKESQKVYLETLSSEKFYIIGGTNAVGTEVATELEAYGTIERISGETRAETSVKVAEKFFTDADTVVLAYAKEFPDGLCGGALAATKNVPVILTVPGKEEAAASYVQKTGIYAGIILGGTTRITDDAVRTVFGLDANAEIIVK